MLQQTRVDTVIPYFLRFVGDFPTIHQLAEAPIDSVLARWAGLGYYRRARSLHAAAKEIVERFGGEVPSTVEQLRSLPGVGAYTAGAVASIAFGRAAPIVDGNVARVLSRRLGMRDPIDSPTGQRRLWEEAARLVPSDEPGTFNQGLMELGSLVCTPTSPLCLTCPVRAGCRAATEGTQDELPILAKKSAVRSLQWTAALASKGQRLLLAQRPLEGLFAGLWEPPMLSEKELFLGLGIELFDEPRGSVEHRLSHRLLTVSVFEARARRLPEAIEGYAQVAWLDPRDPEVALSTLARKVIGLAGTTEAALSPKARRTKKLAR